MQIDQTKKTKLVAMCTDHQGHVWNMVGIYHRGDLPDGGAEDGQRPYPYAHCSLVAQSPF